MKERHERIPNLYEGSQWALEYGVPDQAVAYKCIWQRVERDDIDMFDLINMAIPIVEEEARKNRPGTFITSWINPKNGEMVIEIWGWAD